MRAYEGKVDTDARTHHNVTNTFISYLVYIIPAVVWVASTACVESDVLLYGYMLGELQ